MRATLVGLVAALALASPAAALAVNCAPPGTSGVDQYLETIPGSSCNTPFPGAGGHGPRLPASTVRQLRADGSAGIAVERLVASTGTAGELSAGSRGAGGGSSAGGQLSGGNGTSSGVSGKALPSALLGAVPSGSGDGALLPILLVTVLLVAVGAIVARRRQIGGKR